MSHWFVEKEEQGERLDHFIWKKLQKNVSKRWIQRHVEKNHCRCNHQIERFSSRRLQVGDSIQWISPPVNQAESSPSPSILFESASLLICNKPAHLCCDSSERGILSYLPSSSSPLYLVHRLDKGTSGALILAKSREKQNQIQNLFRQRKIKKLYWAITDGLPLQSSGSCTHFLQKKREENHATLLRRYRTESGGKQAVMEWKVLQKGKGKRIALLACIPHTGRTHQIRAQLAWMQTPLLGEREYSWGRQKSSVFASRPLLHAKQIAWYDSREGRTYTFHAPLPQDFSLVLAEMKRKNRPKSFR